MYLVFVLYALFASVFIFAKEALNYTSPLFLVGTRMLAAGVLMLVYIWFFHRDSFVFKKKHLWRIIRLAVFNIYLTNVFEFWGLKYLTSFKTCFIYSLSPFLSALFSYLILSENMTSKKWLGMLIGMVGFIPILMASSASEELTGQFFIFSWAEIAVMSAAVCSVYGWILLRQLVKDDGYSPLMVNGMSMFIGGAFALVHSGIVDTWQPIPVTEIVPFIQYTIILMVVSNLVAYNLYGALLKKYTATFMSFAGFTTPLFTAFFGWMFLNEFVDVAFYQSAVIVFLGLIIFHQEELKDGFRSKVSPKKEDAVLEVLKEEQSTGVI
jgi:drug/metabolite transporter (DMT)-like permease